METSTTVSASTRLWIGFSAATLFLFFASLAFLVPGIGPLANEDVVLYAVHAWRSDTFTSIIKIATFGGDQVVVAPAAVLLVARLWVRRRSLALFVATSISGSALLSVLFKHLINRERPSPFLRLEERHFLSFPSGHSMAAMSLGLTLALLVRHLRTHNTPSSGSSAQQAPQTPSRSPRVGSFFFGACALFVTTVGLTRLYLGVHYPSDVIGGWSLSASWVLTMYLLFVGPFRTNHGAA